MKTSNKSFVSFIFVLVVLNSSVNGDMNQERSMSILKQKNQQLSKITQPQKAMKTIPNFDNKLIQEERRKLQSNLNPFQTNFKLKNSDRVARLRDEDLIPFIGAVITENELRNMKKMKNMKNMKKMNGENVHQDLNATTFKPPIKGIGIKNMTTANPLTSEKVTTKREQPSDSFDPGRMKTTYIPVFAQSTETDYFGRKFGTTVIPQTTMKPTTQFSPTLFRDVVDVFTVRDRNSSFSSSEFEESTGVGSTNEPFSDEFPFMLESTQPDSISESSSFMIDDGLESFSLDPTDDEESQTESWIITAPEMINHPSVLNIPVEMSMEWVRQSSKDKREDKKSSKKYTFKILQNQEQSLSEISEKDVSKVPQVLTLQQQVMNSNNEILAEVTTQPRPVIVSSLPPRRFLVEQPQNGFRFEDWISEKENLADSSLNFQNRFGHADDFKLSTPIFDDSGKWTPIL